MHATPTEHQALPLPEGREGDLGHLTGNLKGWIQHRKTLEEMLAIEKELAESVNYR